MAWFRQQLGRSNLNSQRAVLCTTFSPTKTRVRRHANCLGLLPASLDVGGTWSIIEPFIKFQVFSDLTLDETWNYFAAENLGCSRCLAREARQLRGAMWLN